MELRGVASRLIGLLRGSSGSTPIATEDARVGTDSRLDDLLTSLERCSVEDFLRRAPAAAAEVRALLPEESALVEAVEAGDPVGFDHALAWFQRLRIPADAPPAPVTGDPVASVGAWEDGFELALSGDRVGDDALVLTCGDQTLRPVWTAREGVLLRARFRLAGDDVRCRAVAAGAWTVRREQAGKAPASCPPVTLPAPGAEAMLLTDLARVTAYRTPWGALAVRIAEPRPLRTPGEELRDRLHYHEGVAVRPGTVFAECFSGKQVADSPRAITDALAAEGYEGTIWWSVTSMSVAVPEYAIPLLRETPAWYEALASAEFILNNTTFPWWFRKNPGQTYIQTWHGSPWKRIGLDQPRHGTTANYREILRTEPQQWDYLLAADDTDAAIYESAFASPATVLVGTLPRNDALVNATPESCLAARERLGVSPDADVTAYLPTWREEIPDVEAMPLEQIVAAYVAQWRTDALDTDVLLVRLHHETNRTTLPALDDPRIKDVSDWPDVNDIYLASDRLVTDYSSAMFDYALLGRPVQVHSPDSGPYAHARGAQHRAPQNYQ